MYKICETPLLSFSYDVEMPPPLINHYVGFFLLEFVKVCVHTVAFSCSEV